MHHSEQKMSKKFLRPAARPMRSASTIFAPPPHFLDKSYAPVDAPNSKLEIALSEQHQTESRQQV